MEKKRGVFIQLIALLARIPLTRIIGDEGNGIYSAAFEVYTILLLLSVWCMPETLAKMIHARMAREQYKNVRRVVKVTMMWNFIMSVIVCAIMIIASDYLASYILLVPMSTLTIKILGPSVFLAGFVAALRGYFQGMGTYMPTIVSDGIQQIVTIIASIIGALFLCNYGIKVAHLLHNNSFAAGYAVMGIGVGTLIGLFFSLLFLLFVKSIYKRKTSRLLDKDLTKGNESNGDIIRSMLYILIPLVITGCIYNLNLIIDQILYNGVMTINGKGTEQVVNFGIYAGKYRVLMNIPIVLASAMWIPIVHALENSYQKVDGRLIRNKIMSVYRISMIIVMPFAIGYPLLARPVLNMLFKGNVTLSANLLLYGSSFIVFYSFYMVGNAVLQGIGRTRIVNINAFLGLVIHVLSLMLMLKYLNLDIYAIVYANIVMAVFMCCFNYIAINRYLKFTPEWVRVVGLPFVCALVASGIAKLIYTVLNGSIGNNSALIVSILISFIAYISIIITIRLLNEKEIKSMPGGTVILRIAKLIRLMP